MQDALPAWRTNLASSAPSGCCFFFVASVVLPGTPCTQNIEMKCTARRRSEVSEALAAVERALMLQPTHSGWVDAFARERCKSDCDLAEKRLDGAVESRGGRHAVIRAYGQLWMQLAEMKRQRHLLEVSRSDSGRSSFRSAARAAIQSALWVITEQTTSSPELAVGSVFWTRPATFKVNEQELELLSAVGAYIQRCSVCVEHAFAEPNHKGTALAARSPRRIPWSAGSPHFTVRSQAHSSHTMAGGCAFCDPVWWCLGHAEQRTAEAWHR